MAIASENKLYGENTSISGQIYWVGGSKVGAVFFATSTTTVLVLVLPLNFT